MILEEVPELGTYSTTSWSYREYDVQYGTGDYYAWESWMAAHRVPIHQVPLKGWAARDTQRNTVSVLLFDWNPDDEQNPKFGAERGPAFIYVDTDDDGNRNKNARFRVFTVQLEAKPLPFPEPDTA